MYVTKHSHISVPLEPEEKRRFEIIAPAKKDTKRAFM